MTTAAVATATSPLWFATRATGLTAFVLLTCTVLLGILTSLRITGPAWPRFVTIALHRNISLLTIAFTGLHVLTTVADPYVSISVASVVVPFASAYRRIWLGFGAVAFDLLSAVLITSLLRARIGPRVWRLVHWAGYLCWPVVLVHGMGTGTDGGARWVLAISVASALAVAVAGAWRLAAGWPAHAALRVAVAGAAVLLAVITAAWAWAGPLSPGWSRRAGTPVALLAHGATASSGSGSGSSTGDFPALAFQRQVAGTVSNAPGPAAGDRTVTIAMSSGDAVRLRIVLTGPATGGDGVDMRSSQVSLGPATDPSRYTGQVAALSGSLVQAVVAGAGQRIAIAVDLTLSGNSAAGTLTATQASETSDTGE